MAVEANAQNLAELPHNRVKLAKLTPHRVKECIRPLGPAFWGTGPRSHPVDVAAICCYVLLVCARKQDTGPRSHPEDLQSPKLEEILCFQSLC